MRLTSREGTRPGRKRRRASSARRAGAAAAVVAALAFVFLLDQRTGSAPVQHLYYVPIILASLAFGLRGSIATPLAAVLLYHAANPRLIAFGYEHWDVVQVALFLAVGLITAKLADDKRRLHLLATTDDLTGLHNLRSFEARLAVIIPECRERQRPLALLVLDLDRLKSLNDVYGHLSGAEAVRAVGRVIAAGIPRDAVACRYGGDEFVIALPGRAEADARSVADDLRHAVHALAPELAGIRFPAQTLSISIGVACETFAVRDDPPPPSDQGEALFRAADRALYEAKALGRNHVATA